MKELFFTLDRIILSRLLHQHHLNIRQNLFAYNLIGMGTINSKSYYNVFTASLINNRQKKKRGGGGKKGVEMYFFYWWFLSLLCFILYTGLPISCGSLALSCGRTEGRNTVCILFMNFHVPAEIYNSTQFCLLTTIMKMREIKMLY